MTTLLDEQDIALLEEDYDDDEESLFYEYDDDDEAFLAEYDDDDEEGLFYEYDDDDDEAFLAEYDDYDDEGLGEDLAERRRYFRGRRRGRSRRYRRPSYRRSYLRRRPARARGMSRGIAGRIRGVRSAKVQTPRGTARIRLPATVVSKKELESALSTLSARVGKEIRKNSSAISGVKKAIGGTDKATRKNFSSLERKLSGFEKSINKKLKQSQDQTMMYALLPMFMQTKPQLESLSLTPADDSEHKYSVKAYAEAGEEGPIGNTMTLTPDKDAKREFTVSESKFKAADQMSTMMPLALMMGMGSFGGSGGSQNQMMMMLMIMMMQQQSSSQK